MTDATTSPADGWNDIAQHAAMLQQTTMMHLFGQDPARARRYNLSAAGLTLDYAKNLIDERWFTLFGALYNTRNLDQARTAMLHGEAVNSTEMRPALHTLLRAPQPPQPRLQADFTQVQASLASVARISNTVRDGSWVGHSGKTITDVLHLGIGGSYLGPRMVDEALSPCADADGPSIRCHYVANVDGLHIDQVLARLDQASTLVIVVSKSFATVETRVNAESAQAWLRQKVPVSELHRHAVAVTTNIDAAKAFGIADENILPMWDWVGGRYSLWSAVGLPLAIKYGINHFNDLLAGAHAMDTHFAQAPWPDNMPMIMAALGVWYHNFMDAGSHAILPYDHSLRLLPAHLQQLDMESNGKSVSRGGKAVSTQTGPIIWGGEGTNGQHAFHQLLHQGTRFTSLDFIVPLRAHHDRTEHHDWLVANCFSQSQALLQGRGLEDIDDTDSVRRAHKVMPGNRPSNTLIMDQLTPGTLGALIALYEHKVFCQAQIWDINPFDQWGVELGKQLSDGLYGAITGGPLPAMDPSTAHLLSLYRQQRKESADE